MKKYIFYMLAVILASISFPGYSLADTPGGSIEWISHSDVLNQGNSNSSQGVISSDGRYIAFSSYARLISEDLDGFSDIYLRDRLTGNLELISVASNGAKGNANSFHPAISSDGRYIAFYSNATNLAEGAQYGVYVRDMATGKTELVSKSSNGAAGNQASVDPAISADGRYIAFTSQATNLVNVKTFGPQIYVHDQLTGNTELGSISSTNEAGFGDSKHPSISSDGRYVAFVSYANNLVEGDTNQAWDAFVHDRNTGKTIRVSISSSGEESLQPIGYAVQGVRYPSISPDGKNVAFYSLATNLANVNTNGKWNVFIHNITTGSTEIVSLKQDGQGMNDNFPPSDVIPNYVSLDGRFIVYQINSAALVDGSNNLSGGIFVKDRIKGITEELNLVTLYGRQANGAIPSINSSGRYIVFQTSTNSLVKEDSNWGLDVYLYDLGERDTTVRDTDAPNTMARVSGIEGQNNWYISNVIVSFTAVDNEGGSDIAKTEYSLDGVNWNTYTTPIAINKEGITKIFYRSLDNAGNLENAKEQEINIDKTAPLITTNLQNDLVIERFGTIRIENSGEDNISGVANLETTLDGNSINNLVELNLENLSFGSHMIVIRGMDSAGNNSEVAISFRLTANMETLAKLLERDYSNGLIDNKGVYQSLTVKVENKSLTPFINAVEAQKGKHINDSAGMVLLEYAEWLKNN